jgi:hypothetical protein
VEFVEHKGTSALRIPPGVEREVFKDLNLTSGIVDEKTGNFIPDSWV